MSQSQRSQDIKEIIKTYPEPEELSFEKPHHKNVYAKPVKYRNKWCLDYDCYETGNALFPILFDDAMKDIDIHEFFKQNHAKYTNFSAHWRRVTKLKIKVKAGDIVYDKEDDEVYVVKSIAPESQRYVHPQQYDNYCFITAAKIDIDRTENIGRVRTETGKQYLLNHQHIEKLGNLHQNKIIFKILKKYKYIDAKKICNDAIKRKLRTATNPTKRPKKINKIWNLFHFVFIRYIKIELEKNNIEYSIRSKMATVKLRKSEFDSIFKQLNRYSMIETKGDSRLGYLDYIVLKINLKLNTFRIMALFLIYDEESEEILGEDLIPDEW